MFSKERPVHVVIPESLNLKQVEKVTASVLNLVGCPHCHSGYDFRFHQEEVIVFGKDLEPQTLNARGQS